jgi:hypothetical protein
MQRLLSVSWKEKQVIRVGRDQVTVMQGGSQLHLYILDCLFAELLGMLWLSHSLSTFHTSSIRPIAVNCQIDASISFFPSWCTSPPIMHNACAFQIVLPIW